MSNGKLIWAIVFIFGVIGLIVSGIRQAGSTYVQETEKIYRQYDVPDEKAGEGARKNEWVGFAVNPDSQNPTAEVQQEIREHEAEIGQESQVTGVPDVTLITTQKVDPILKNDPGVHFSWAHTVGLWIAGLLTLCVLSFLWGDNVFYKVAESIVIGTSAAYVMVAAFWPMIVENLFGNLIPNVIRAWSYPGLLSDGFDWVFLFPLVMCCLLLWRLSPKGGWIARWPLAFFIGATAGFRLIAHLESDFTMQVQAAIVPLIVIKESGGFDFWTSLTNVIMTFGVLVTLVYFFFSIEHKGIVGKTARVGIWFLMITFGAAFGMTVMGRIALLAERFQFLVDDWLWLIDPTGKRAVALLMSMLV